MKEQEYFDICHSQQEHRKYLHSIKEAGQTEQKPRGLGGNKVNTMTTTEANDQTETKSNKVFECDISHQHVNFIRLL